MATEKLFRIICYLKSLRFVAIEESADEGFWISSLHLKSIRCLPDVLYIESEACEIFCGSDHADMRVFSRQMHACSNFSRLDVLLIQPLFIPPGIDVPLQCLKLLSRYKNTFVAHNDYETLMQSLH